VADTFAGVALTVLPGGITDETPVTFSERVIPGSSPAEVYIDVAAAGARRITLPLFAATFTGFDSLRALVGTTAALSYATAGGGGVTITSALLVRLSQRQVAPLGQTWADAEFLVVTP
jgi:hypothetical protein